MQWADAIPNFLIGLREGLEAALVVSILLAALRKTGEGASSAAVWLGVLGAVTMAGSFAAVLTASTDALSSSAQEAVGGLLSVLAVGLVTGMVFWMRRTARTLSSHLKGEVARALAVGAGALTLTAFLAVGREGLETTLFLWTAVRASGSTVAPLVGAAAGLAAAVLLCWLLYRQSVRLDLGAFFNRTALALIVIATGVLAYGLGDLQDAGLLAGREWVAFDLTATIDPNTWWVSILTGVTELAPRMTVLQVVAWVAYLAVVVPAFLRAGAVSPTAAPSGDRATAGRWERLVTARAWPVAAALVVVPALVATLMIVALPSAQAAASTTAVTVTGTACGTGWTAGHTGAQTFAVDNRSGAAGEINLDDASGAVVAEIETIGPATTATMNATLGPGRYRFTCLMSGGTTHGAPVEVTGAQQATTTPVTPVTLADVTGPNRQYQSYAAQQLTALAAEVAGLRAAVAANDLAAARRDWLTAQMGWERVGASYDSFGANGLAVDGLPDGLPGGVTDPGFTGLHRVEYGLWHGQSAAQLLPAVDTLAAGVATVAANLDGDDEAGDPTNLPLRVHEVLEDALRDHLSGVDDDGAGMAYAETYADTEVTRTLLGEVAPLVGARIPGLVPTVDKQLGDLQAALLATQAAGQWQAVGQVSQAGRERVDAALGAVLESLSVEPNLLEVPPSH